MAGKGGYMRPNEPAAVSGPGKFSQRTDGGPGETPTQAARYISGGSYGEGKALMDIQQGAAMAAGSEPVAPIPLSEATRYPDEPVTTGNPKGAGAGPEVLMAPLDQPEQDEIAAAIRAAYVLYPSPSLRAMIQRLERDGR